MVLADTTDGSRRHYPASRVSFDLPRRTLCLQGTQSLLQDTDNKALFPWFVEEPSRVTD